MEANITRQQIENIEGKLLCNIPKERIIEISFKAGKESEVEDSARRCAAYLESARQEGRKEEAKNIIACIKDAKRVHPEWTIKNIIELLLFREETRIAMSNRGSKKKGL